MHKARANSADLSESSFRQRADKANDKPDKPETYARLVSYCMAIWLLAVTVCGWCCHAPHACSAERVKQTTLASTAATSASHECACRDCKHAPTGKKSPAAPCKCPHECLGLCKTLPKPRSNVEFKPSIAPLAIDAVVQLPIDLHGSQTVHRPVQNILPIAVRLCGCIFCTNFCSFELPCLCTCNFRFANRTANRNSHFAQAPANVQSEPLRTLEHEFQPKPSFQSSL